MITDNEAEILQSMDGQTDWLRPLDLGGRDGSHHSYTLKKLEGRGWVESRQRRAWSTRGSKEYRLTAAGQGEANALKQSWGHRG